MTVSITDSQHTAPSLRPPGVADVLANAVVDDAEAGIYRANRRIFTDEEIFELEIEHIFEGNWDTITFTGPNGSFFLRETDRPVLLLAGGTDWPRCCRCSALCGAARTAARHTSSTASAPTRTWWLSTRSRRSPRH